MTDEKIKTQLIEISKKYELDLLILFGSRAKGTHKQTSDYDLAFIKFAQLTTSNEFDMLTEIETLLKKYKVDIINLGFNKSILLHHNIFRFGKPIYEKQEKTFKRLKEQTYFEYMDYSSLFGQVRERYISKAL